MAHWPTAGFCASSRSELIVHRCAPHRQRGKPAKLPGAGAFTTVPWEQIEKQQTLRDLWQARRELIDQQECARVLRGQKEAK